MLATVIVIVASVALLWTWFNRPAEAPASAGKEETSSEPVNPEPVYEAPDLQPTVDAWVQKYSASYHIAIYDLQGDKLIGSHEPDTELFAASLYKLYIAYFLYKDFDLGNVDPSEILRGNQTMLECADAMIRTSDSPCGEAAMAYYGQTVLNDRVAGDLGTTTTIFNGIETSASDIIQVLKFIYAGKYLTDEYKAKLMDSMLDQPAMYRRGLAAGAPDAIWHTKVGWNLDINYHDVGFMTLPDGRIFAVAILGQGSGSPAPIANFASTIYSALK